MKERPILFSGPMVRAILDGRKTQTRRLVAPQPATGETISWLNNIVGRPPSFALCRPMSSDVREVRCPYGAPGDRLWVKETWALEDVGDDGQRLIWKIDRAARWLGDGETIHYLDSGYKPARWRSGRFMPRWASRLSLEVTGVRAQRLQDISEEDARAEGLKVTGPTVSPTGEIIDRRPGYLGYGSLWHDPRRAFETIWDDINGKRALWSSNPWVWVVEFKRVAQEAKAA